ncbi:MAG: histidine kinase, partial [Elusimicrobia bacterium]|nr:histidine kinase [Elusimicrobiota bacterium]
KLTAVGRLSAGVAHEINNPLGIILGFAQSMKARLKPGDSMTLPVQSIAREAERCRDLVQSLLQFTRGGAAEHREELDMNAAVEQALALVKAQGGMSRVEVVRRLAPGLPLIRANRTQFQQIVVNLGGNAVDAMPQGGVLTVETARVEGRPGVVLRISDTGMGIPPEIRSKIFDPFFTTKEVGKGTGLGLALVHEIVHKHGGTIELESAVGRGTTFRVFLPLDAGASPAGPP